MLCKHERMLCLQAKCSDMCSVTWPSGHDTDGYAPKIEGLGGGDYICIEICIDCKTIPRLASAKSILQVQAALAEGDSYENV